jgi:hypothetical protein
LTCATALFVIPFLSFRFCHSVGIFCVAGFLRNDKKRCNSLIFNYFPRKPPLNAFNKTAFLAQIQRYNTVWKVFKPSKRLKRFIINTVWKVFKPSKRLKRFIINTVWKVFKPSKRLKRFIINTVWKVSNLPNN